MKHWRYCWALPATMLGLALAAVALPWGRIRIVDGVLEAHGPGLRWVLTRCVPLRGGAAAITLGHVVVGRDQHALDWTRAHERVHVRQYERWGALLVPAYLIASLYATLNGGHYYFDNAFEREACRCPTDACCSRMAPCPRHCSPELISRPAARLVR